MIKTSSDHIQVLEQNLLDCLSLLKTNEKADASTYTSQIEEESKPIDTNCTNELKLISVLQVSLISIFILIKFNCKLIKIRL